MNSTLFICNFIAHDDFTNNCARVAALTNLGFHRLFGGERC